MICIKKIKMDLIFNQARYILRLRKFGYAWFVKVHVS